MKSTKYLYCFIIILLGLLFTCGFAQASLIDQKPGGAINDFAQVLSTDNKESLEALCISLHEKTGVSLVLVTVQSLDSVDINTAATDLFAKWGIGKKGVDEGILVLVAVADRQIRIETGYGSEGYITDADASRIIRDIIGPLLTKQKWNEGCAAGLYVLAARAANAHSVSLDSLPDMPSYSRVAVPVSNRKLNPVTLLLLGVLVLFLIFTRTGRAILLFMILSSLSSRGSSGSGSGGGFGGGFGGFGGGMSGGGGASGRF